MTLYDNTSELTGPLQEGQDRTRYRDVLSTGQKAVLYLLGLVILAIGGTFIAVIADSVSGRWTRYTAVILVLSVLVELVRIGQSWTLWSFARRAKWPIPMVPQRGLRVAVLTTIVPKDEPFEMAASTLLAMGNMTAPPGARFDVWLLDEGNEPHIAQWCRENGVRHFSRKGIARFNEDAGPWQAKTKHGNHNAWRYCYEEYYHAVVQMDMDHVPEENFLMRTMGYFRDPDVAFVVAPQVYGNRDEGFVPHGSAFAAYVFHGVIQPGGNGREAPLLIGTNHAYRTAAFREIGGYQPSIIEDHLTSMVVFANVNPETGRRWKGVYTPDILSVGEGPMSWTNWFKQQKRWAYGIWEILLSHSPRLFGRLKAGQRFTFGMLQSFYPSVALTWVVSNVISGLYWVGGERFSTGVPIGMWAVFWSSSILSGLVLFWWLRRFNLAAHEKRDWGLKGMALMLFTIPVYTSAAWSAVLRRPLTYAVTNKGSMASTDSLITFRPHLLWAAAIGGALTASLFGVGSDYTAVRGWMVFNLIICLMPVGICHWQRARSNRTRNVTLEAEKLPTFESSLGSSPWVEVPEYEQVLASRSDPSIDGHAVHRRRAGHRIAVLAGERDDG